ncbi:MAG TPA: hypothetical protein PLX89_13740 [Verrucomicrobiota bacterium]|nr:hypothetical protein [Verrucomicrobiota bacterium]
MQVEFDFSAGPADHDGLTAWRRHREQQLLALAKANGLPLGRRCRGELCGEVVLEGTLRLAEDELLIFEPTRDLNLKLQINRCSFSPREIVSVVRLD